MPTCLLSKLFGMSSRAILALTFLGLRNRKLFAYGFSVLTLTPLLYGLIVPRYAGWTFTPVLVVHWGTAALMLLIVELLRRGSEMPRRSARDANGWDGLLAIGKLTSGLPSPRRNHAALIHQGSSYYLNPPWSS